MCDFYTYTTQMSGKSLSITECGNMGNWGPLIKAGAFAIYELGVCGNIPGKNLCELVFF